MPFPHVLRYHYLYRAVGLLYRITLGCVDGRRSVSDPEGGEKRFEPLRGKLGLIVGDQCRRASMAVDEVVGDGSDQLFGGGSS